MIIKKQDLNYLGLPNSELTIKNYDNIKEVKLGNIEIKLQLHLFYFLVNFIKKAEKATYVSFKDEDWNYGEKTLQRYSKKINDECKNLGIKNLINARRCYGYYLNTKSFLLIE